MNVESILDGLGEEAASALRVVLKKAYERGYREALATHRPAGGDAAGAATAPSPVQPPPAAPPSAPPPASPQPSAVTWQAGAETEDGSDEEDTGDTRDEPRPISAGASVGTLRERIVKLFALDRFDVDVVICRRGDRERRQLKTSTRLSSYFVEEGS